MHVRGQYERLPTDTAHLASELSAPQDVARLARDFDDGVTPLRDVGRMFTAQRTAILEAYQAGTVGDIATTYPEILSRPVQNLHERVASGPQDQPIGHNFFVNATGFLDARLPWARQFDELLRRRTGASIYDIAGSNDSVGKDRLLAAITENPDTELMTTLAVYLAGRSLEGEKYLKQQYGEVLERHGNHINIEVKNRFEVGDSLELMTTSGNITFTLTEMLDKKGQPTHEAKGSGHIVDIPVPADVDMNYALLIRNLPHSSGTIAAPSLAYQASE